MYFDLLEKAICVVPRLPDGTRHDTDSHSGTGALTAVHGIIGTSLKLYRRQDWLTRLAKQNGDKDGSTEWARVVREQVKAAIWLVEHLALLVNSGLMSAHFKEDLALDDVAEDRTRMAMRWCSLRARVQRHRQNTHLDGIMDLHRLLKQHRHLRFRCRIAVPFMIPVANELVPGLPPLAGAGRGGSAVRKAANRELGSSAVRRLASLPFSRR